MSDDTTLGGLTVDGVPIPLAIEVAGADAIEAYALEHLTAPLAPPSEPIIGEGDEA